MRPDVDEDLFLEGIARAVIAYRTDDAPEPERRARLEQALAPLQRLAPWSLGAAANAIWRHLIRELSTVEGGRRDWRWWWRLRGLFRL